LALSRQARAVRDADRRAGAGGAVRPPHLDHRVDTDHGRGLEEDLGVRGEAEPEQHDQAGLRRSARVPAYQTVAARTTARLTPIEGSAGRSDQPKAAAAKARTAAATPSTRGMPATWRARASARSPAPSGKTALHH